MSVLVTCPRCCNYTEPGRPCGACGKKIPSFDELWGTGR